MKILVAGATGFIGSELIEYLAINSDFEVVGKVRSMEGVSTNPTVEPRLGEIGYLNKKRINLSDIDVIIHTAGRAHIMNDCSDNTIKEFRRVNIDGETNLLLLPRDDQALTNNIVRLIDNDKLADEFGNSARKRYENLFSGEALSKTYYDLYGSVL